MKLPGSLGRAFWLCAAFTFVSAAVSVTFSLLSLRMAGGQEYALYAASRSIALPLAVVYASSRRSRAGVAALALAMTLVQLLDGFIGLHFHDPSRSYGPLAFAAINFGLLLWMNQNGTSGAEAK